MASIPELPQSDVSASIPTSMIAPEELRTDRRLLHEVRRLSRISEPRTLIAIAFQWAVILLAAALWCTLPPSLGPMRWVLYLAAVTAIASRQHALLILMHEAAHSRVSRHRPWNDFVGDMFCAFPLGLSTELYRRRHLQHHQHTNTELDPDWTIIRGYEDWNWPKDQIEAFKLFATDFIGLGAHKILFTFMLWSPSRKLFFKRKLRLSPSERLHLIAFCTTVVGTFSICHLWLFFFMFWVVPFLTALVPISRLRTVAEHMVVESEHELNKTRHVNPTFLERMILAPLNVNYHLTHHLYPTIPFYNLPEMHRILMREPVFRDSAHLTESYWGLRHGVWAEVTRKKTRSA